MRTKSWRTMFSVPNLGYFVWEISECDDVTAEDEKRYPNTYLQMRDDTYVLRPFCHHFWNEAKAFEFLHDNSFPEFVKNIVID